MEQRLEEILRIFPLIMAERLVFMRLLETLEEQGTIAREKLFSDALKDLESMRSVGLKPVHDQTLNSIETALIDYRSLDRLKRLLSPDKDPSIPSTDLVDFA